MSINRDISRPKPTATWTADWPWRARGQQVHNRRTTTVSASYAADMDEGLRDNGPDIDASIVPNNITVTLRHRDPDREESLRFTREAAQLLIEQLTAALEWDG